MSTLIPCAVCSRESHHNYCREHDPDPERQRARHAARYYRRRQRGRQYRSPYHALYRELGRVYRKRYTGVAA